MSYDTTPNRNALHKSLPVTDDETSLFQNLERATPEQLALLKKSYWLNKDKCPDEVIDSMKLDFLDKMTKPQVFEKKHHYALDPLLLFTQFTAFQKQQSSSRRGKEPIPDGLLHNFNRRSPVYRQLFRWAPHMTVTRIFQPIHYLIHVKGRVLSRDRPNPRRIECLADLQNALIHSYWKASTPQLKSLQLVEKMEDFLDAILSQILMRSSRALFVFEWRESPRFQYVVCLDLLLPGVTVEDPSTSTMLTLERNDLFEEEEGGMGISTLAEAKSEPERMRFLLKEGQPSYVCNAFVRCDD